MQNVSSTGWSLFLDRDGVINTRPIGDYVKGPEEFEFIPGVKEALKTLAEIFKPIVVVTNQQGICKGLMTEEDLKEVHQLMLDEILSSGGRLDAIYHCPFLAGDHHPDRKPNTGMALKAREQFPSIDFKRSVMVGDSDTDIIFGKSLGMICVEVGTGNSRPLWDADYAFKDLQEFAAWIATHKKSVLL